MRNDRQVYFSILLPAALEQRTRARPVQVPRKQRGFIRALLALFRLGR
jgi:hypothetical protein